MQEIEDEEVNCSCKANKQDEFIKKLFSEYKQDKDNLIQMLNEIQEHYRLCTNGCTKRIIRIFIYTNGRNLWSCYILF